jgi:short-subunit dehydrogenase
MELRGSVAVVTGASSGIGWATGWALAGAGSRVVLAARRTDRLDELAGQIRSRGGEALGVRCDVTSVEDLEALRDRTLETFGRCDVLVNIAGIPGGGRFDQLSLEQVERVVATNYLSVVRATKQFLPILLDQGRGHVVNVASLAGRFAVPGSSVYSSTKHAVVAFSEALYYELAPRGVLVTAVNPGLVRTEGFPQRGRRRGVLMSPERVAEVIVDVIRRDRAPEVFVPRWVSTLQAARVLAPGPYRWGIRRITRNTFRPTPAPENDASD